MRTRHSLILCLGNAKCFNLMNMNLTTSNKIVHALPFNPIQSSPTIGKYICTRLFNLIFKRAQKKKSVENVLPFILKGGRNKTIICSRIFAKINTERINQKPGISGEKVERIKGEVHP